MNIDEYADKIIDMYTTKHLTTTQIAKELGCSSSGVSRLLNRNGITRIYTPNRLILNDNNIENIVRQYNEGSTTAEIAKEFGICDRSVAKILRQKGVQLRSASRRSNVSNHRYFEVIDTPAKAYFLGWMISDGSIIRSKTRPNRSSVISLEISTEDEYILYLFANELGASPSIVKREISRGHSYVRFASEIMASDLERYGVVPNKSWITYLPLLDTELMSHLIRGIFDGDGTVTTDKDGYNHFAFYGSEELCRDISNHLHKFLGINNNKVSRNTCYHVWWGGKTPCTLFKNYIYSECKEYYLKRKYIKFN